MDVEIFEADLLVGVGILGDGLAHLATDATGGVLLQPVEQLRSILEAAVGEQPLDEVRTRVEDLVRFLGHAAFRRLGRRRQLARLEFEQGRRHDDEVAGDVEVQALPEVDGRHELVGDGGDRDLDDVEFGPPDEVQQQIHRPAELVERDDIPQLERLSPAGGGRGRGGNVGFDWLVGVAHATERPRISRPVERLGGSRTVRRAPDRPRTWLPGVPLGAQAKRSNLPACH